LSVLFSARFVNKSLLTLVLLTLALLVHEISAEEKEEEGRRCFGG
jgi:hypothetical protein